MRDPDDLRWWGVDVDAINSQSKDAAGVVKTPWLPHYVRVRVDTSNGRVTDDESSNPKGGRGGKGDGKGGGVEVSVTQAMGEDDLAALGTTGPESEKDVPKNGRQVDVTYELVGLVCLARRPAEEEDDDSPVSLFSFSCVWAISMTWFFFNRAEASTRLARGSSWGIRWRSSR